MSKKYTRELLREIRAKQALRAAASQGIPDGYPQHYREALQSRDLKRIADSHDQMDQERQAIRDQVREMGPTRRSQEEVKAARRNRKPTRSKAFQRSVDAKIAESGESRRNPQESVGPFPGFGQAANASEAFTKRLMEQELDRWARRASHMPPITPNPRISAEEMAANRRATMRPPLGPLSIEAMEGAAYRHVTGIREQSEREGRSDDQAQRDDDEPDQGG
jgi:hypothetical protein